MQYEIKPLGVGGILDQSVQLLKNHFGLLMGISLCVSVPFNLIIGLINISLVPEPPEILTAQAIQEYQQQVAGVSLKLAGLGLLSLILVYPLTTGAMTYAVASEYLGRPTTVGASVGTAFRKFFPLLLTSVLMFIIVYIGLILCIIPGLYFLVRYSLATYAVVLEGKMGISALKRSSELMTSDRTKNYNSLVLLWLLLGAIGFGVGAVTSIIPQAHVALVVSVLIQAVLASFGAAAFAIFYFSCRCKAENFDLMLLAEAMGEGDDDPTPVAS
ncbi:MAG: hypothetical protein AAF802_30045 [Planctomycetota bacterium]